MGYVAHVYMDGQLAWRWFTVRDMTWLVISTGLTGC
jgi:hypothetical protein